MFNKKAVAMKTLITIIVVPIVLIILFTFVIRARGGMFEGIDNFFTNLFKPH